MPLTPAQLQLLQQHKGPLVKIATHYHVNFGDCLKVIGSSPEFGAWTAADAPLMKWGEGDVWSLVMPLPPGDYEFKVGGCVVCWWVDCCCLIGACGRVASVQT